MQHKSLRLKLSQAVWFEKQLFCERSVVTSICLKHLWDPPLSDFYEEKMEKRYSICAKPKMTILKL